MINNRATPSISDSRIAGPAGYDRGFTLLELLVVVALLGVIAALTVPLLIRMRQSGNEASAIGSMRAINSSQAAYASSCGGGGYAQTLADLALPPPAHAPFISPDMAVGAKSGYITDLSKRAGAHPARPLDVQQRLGALGDRLPRHLCPRGRRIDGPARVRQ